MPELGIVILNYNNWEDTARCLESIWANPPQAAYQVILVDNASTVSETDEVREMIFYGEVVLIKNKDNLGYNGGNNVGIKKALEMGCQGILLTNNDVCFTPRCMQEMWEYSKAHPEWTGTEEQPLPKDRGKRKISGANPIARNLPQKLSYLFRF